MKVSLSKGGKIYAKTAEGIQVVRPIHGREIKDKYCPILGRLTRKCSS
jgi:hypothetical protein